MAMAIPEEISMIVSSDPSQGATNISPDGSYFEIQLQDGLMLPKDALNINIAVEESTVWWVVPNTITGVNDKMYLTGTTKSSIDDIVALGYPVSADLYIDNALNPGVPTLIISNPSGLPLGSFVVGDKFRPDAGSTSGTEYEMLTVVQDIATFQSYTVSSYTIDIAQTQNAFSRVRPSGVSQHFDITIPNGLYDLSGLNNAISRELELMTPMR
jgi:hypothetical protein